VPAAASPGAGGAASPDPAAVEKRLYSIRYHAAEESHISIVDPALCQTCAQPCLWFCPAAVYRLEHGQVGIAYENCLECGTCRIACPHGNIEWRNPTGGFGIAYRRG
jgi:ferredoxin like protein